MIDFPISSVNVELDLAEAVADDLFTPTGVLLGDLQVQSAMESAPSCIDIWDCQDAATWTPGMWWLLNWWTWEYPASRIEVNVIAPGAPLGVSTDSSAIYTIELAPDPTTSTPPLGPSLADLGDQDGSHEPPPPPQLQEVVEQFVVRGTGIIDLLA
ncbi:MAG: hypothetical protein P8K80_09775 [Phycisphaerales bacterium]|nr:hypothetical protein [Phycisphaerales bacterium]